MRLGIGSLGVAVAVPIGAMAIAWSGFGPLPLPAPTELLAQSLYLRGTKIGSYTDDDGAFVDFANGVIGQTTGTPGALVVDDGDDWMSGDQIEYNGGFWPVSQGGLNDLTYGASVAQGLDRLDQRVEAEGTDDTIVVVGYSQSAVILSQYKAQTANGNIVYVLISNPARPNGGILSRFRGFTIPIVDIPLSGPAPTTSPGWEPGDDPTTFDVTQQYDGWADFPVYPLNLLATGNAILGIVYLHGNYETEVDPAEDLAAGAPNTDTRDLGDTRYYTVGTDLLPLLRPMEQVGVPRPVLIALDAPLRVLVEQGYDRTVNPGESTPARLIRIANPITDAANFVNAIPVGVDDGLEAAGYGRPFGTTSAGMYGVGGPEITPPTESIATTRKAAENEAPQHEPASATEKPVSVAEPVKPDTDKVETDDSKPTPVTKPERRRTDRPKVRGPIDFGRSITKTISNAIRPVKPSENAADAPGADTSTGQKSAASKSEADKPAASENDASASHNATGKPDHGGGYVGKHRKSD